MKAWPGQAQPLYSLGASDTVALRCVSHLHRASVVVPSSEAVAGDERWVRGQCAWHFTPLCAVHSEEESGQCLNIMLAHSVGNGQSQSAALTPSGECAEGLHGFPAWTQPAERLMAWLRIPAGDSSQVGC